MRRIYNMKSKNNVMDIRMIYLDPITEKEKEGKAKLLKCIISRKGEITEYWKVKFLSDGFVAERWIKR